MKCLLLLCLTVFVAALPAESINPDSAGWTLVRRVSHTASAWHPATDSLMGTDVYGTYTSNQTADATFSINFNNAVSGWDQILLITGDRQKWMIINKSEILTTSASAFYIQVLASHESATAYNVLIYNRPSGATEDPWLSALDHHYGGRSAGTDDDIHSMLYGENSFAEWDYWLDNRLGANVFIRNSVTAVPEISSGILILLALAASFLFRKNSF